MSARSAPPTRVQALAVFAAIHLVGLGSLTLYRWVAMQHALLEGMEYPLYTSGLMHVLVTGFGLGLAWSRLAPLGGVHQALAQGIAPREIEPSLVRRSLLLHRPMARIQGLTWLLTMLGIVASIEFHGLNAPAEIRVHLAPIGLLMVLVQAMIASQAFRWLQAHHIAPTLLVDGTLDHLEPFEPIRLFVDLMQTCLFLGLVLPGLALLVSTSPFVDPWLGALLFSELALLMAFAIWRILNVISFSAGRLEEQMQQVRLGDFGVRAEVRSLGTLGLLASHFNQMVKGLEQRERIRDTFGRYVTRQVADAILEGHVHVDGERRVATVIFADIRGFTTLSEDLEPEEVLALLNQYLGSLVDCVLDNDGVLDKFIGDAIMALFGVPVSLGSPSDDARAAVRCATEMSQTIDKLNTQRAAQGFPPIEMGIAVHTGEVVAGNLGNKARMEYTVIGDTVNLCSRLEGLTKTLGQRILISESTVALLEHPEALQRVETVSVRGRRGEITVFTPAVQAT